MRSCRPTRGPTSKPVLIVATTANAIGRAGRRLRPEKKPVRAGASPAGLEQQRHGGRRERGRRWATPAAVRRGPDDLPHDTTRRAPAGARRGRGSSSPARKRVTKVDRQGVAAGDCSPITASASRLAERGLRSARSRCPTSSLRDSADRDELRARNPWRSISATPGGGWRLLLGDCASQGRRPHGSRPARSCLIWRVVCQAAVGDFSHLAFGVSGVCRVGWVGGGPGCCARRGSD